MTQVKIFTGNVSDADAVEKKLNAWLAQNETITVKSIETKINSGDGSKYNNGSQLVILVVFQK